MVCNGIPKYALNGFFRATLIAFQLESETLWNPVKPLVPAVHKRDDCLDRQSSRLCTSGAPRGHQKIGVQSFETLWLQHSRTHFLSKDPPWLNHLNQPRLNHWTSLKIELLLKRCWKCFLNCLPHTVAQSHQQSRCSVESILKPILSMTIFLNIQVPQDAENQTQGCTARNWNGGCPEAMAEWNRCPMVYL